MNIENYIRSLARSPYWQEMYRNSKSGTLRLFENETNISGLQYLFLYWLRVYDLVYNEHASKHWQNLDHDVIKDDIRLDAFLYWRRKEIDKENHKHKKEARRGSKKSNKGMQQFNIFKGTKK